MRTILSLSVVWVILIYEFGYLFQPIVTTATTVLK